MSALKSPAAVAVSMISGSCACAVAVWVHGCHVTMAIRLFHTDVCMCNATDRTKRQCTCAEEQDSFDPWGWFGHPEFLLLWIKHYKQMIVSGCVCIAGMRFKQHHAFAQAWDTPGTLKFITKNRKNIYEMIDRFYLCKRVNKTGCRRTRRGEIITAVHRWASVYDNPQATCGL